MTIEPIQDHQWPIFLAMIRQQGWRMNRTEQRLYAAGLNNPFLCLHHEQQVVGFISGCCHGDQAWIGNLIVASSERGNGYGSLLFDTLVIQFKKQGVTTLWLTASEEGQPLYEKRGFVACDQIQRWITPGLVKPDSQLAQTNTNHQRYLHQCDQMAHHQQRKSFLRIIGHNGHVVRSGQNVALLQPSTNLTSLGPWYEQGYSPENQYQCLIEARNRCSRHHQLVTDIYASTHLHGVLTTAGFKQCGTTTLMCWGQQQPLKQSSQRALAGLGSFN